MEQSTISNCIQQLLRDYVARPFLHVREADLQAQLAHDLKRSVTPCEITARVGTRGQGDEGAFEVVTSRIHLEMKVRGHDRSDIVVLREDCRPLLTRNSWGPTDVLYTLKPLDVQAVIELKAVPSRYPGSAAAIAADITKLSVLKAENPHIACFFVLIDKSVSVPGAASSKAPNEQWRRRVNGTIHESDQRPRTGQYVEAWDLAGAPVPRPRVAFWA